MEALGKVISLVYEFLCKPFVVLGYEVSFMGVFIVSALVGILLVVIEGLRDD